MSWEYMKLGDICTKIGSGATPKGGSTVYVENGTSFIRSQNIYNLSFQYDGLVYINDEASEKLKGVTVEAKDILLNITGDSVARTCVVPEDVLPARVNQHVAIIRPMRDIINPIFLNYYLASPYMQSYMLGLAVGKGASRNAITKMMIEDFEVPCPRIDLQEKIVDILLAYDNLIKNNQKQIQLLEEAAQRLYKEWFIDLRFPGHENVEIIDGVPVEWEYLEFLNIAPIITGKKDANFGSENGKYLFFTCSQQPLLAESYSYDCDAVILAGNGDFNVKLYRGKFEAYQRTYVLSPYKTEHLYLLFYTIKNRMNYLIQGASGSTIKFLTKGMIADIKVLVPTCEILNQYNEIAESLQSKLEVLIYQNKLLTEARDCLLPKLMSGEIEV